MGNIVNFNVWVTNYCNLNCEYCYEREKGEIFLEGDAVKDTINFIESYIFKNNVDKCEIHFHGGEPTLNCKCIRDIITVLNEKKM